MARRARNLEEAFVKTVKELRAADIAFAVVGGIAVGVRSEPRYTNDLDFAVSVASDREAEQVIFTLQSRGFLVAQIFENDVGRISTVRTLRSELKGVFIDFLMFNTRIEPEIVSRALPAEVLALGDIPVATLEDLLAMKTLANRKKDLPDIEHLLLKANPRQLERVRRALRLMTSRGSGGPRNLLSEFEKHVRDVLGRPLFERPVSPSRLRRLLRQES